MHGNLAFRRKTQLYHIGHGYAGLIITLLRVSEIQSQIGRGGNSAPNEVLNLIFGRWIVLKAPPQELDGRIPPAHILYRVTENHGDIGTVFQQIEATDRQMIEVLNVILKRFLQS